MCMLFSSSELVPPMYQAKDEASKSKAIANCMIALDMAQRLGANPLMVMQNLYIVHGKPAWSSKFLIASVNTSGRFTSMQYRFEELGTKEVNGIKIDDIRCTAYAKDKRTGEVLESSPISLEMAILEGWYTKNGSKWKTMPKQMLMYRAASFWTNAYAPDISMGIRTAEEVQDIEEATFVDVSHEIETQQATESLSMSSESVDKETGEITESMSPAIENTTQGTPHTEQPEIAF